MSVPQRLGWKTSGKVSVASALKEANNALLDLQAADYNTFARPLKRLANALADESLREVNETLRQGIDFDAFVAESDQGGSMMGSASLDWPEEREKELGLALVLIEKAAADPDWFLNFAHHWYYSGSKLIAGIRKVTTAVLIPFVRDYGEFVRAQRPVASTSVEPSDFHRVFIVHGHDEGARETVARFIEAVGLSPIILHEQANKGMTIPEKLAAHSNVGFAVVLLTPDDEGRKKGAAKWQARPRQNVLLELGYFVGRLGRDRVCALLKGDLEIPSDYVGVAYTPLDDAGWRQKLAQELDAAGYEIDWNKVMSRRA